MKKVLGIVCSSLLFLSAIITVMVVYSTNTNTLVQAAGVELSVETIEAAGVEDSNFATAIYNSIITQPTSFNNGNTLTTNSYTSIEALLNDFTGNINANNAGKPDSAKIVSIKGVILLKSAQSLDVSDNLIADFRDLNAAPIGMTYSQMPDALKHYYGNNNAYNLKVNIARNPLTAYSHWAVGNMLIQMDGANMQGQLIPLANLEFVAVSDGAADFSANYDFPINIYCDNDRAYMDPLGSEVFSISSSVPFSGGIINPTAVLDGQITELPVINITKTGGLVITFANTLPSQWGNGVYNRLGVAQAQQNFMSWEQQLMTSIYTKVEVDMVDTYSGVMLQKIGADDQQPKAGAVYNLYSLDGELVRENLKTAANGYIGVLDLPEGDYYFVEVQAPEGYSVNSERIPFSVQNAGLVVNGGSGKTLIPTNGDAQTTNGTFMLSGDKTTPVRVDTNQPVGSSLVSITVEWTAGNQGGSNGEETFYVTDSISATDVLALVNAKIETARDLYQNVKLSAFFTYDVSLSQLDQPVNTNTIDNNSSENNTTMNNTLSNTSTNGLPITGQATDEQIVIGGVIVFLVVSLSLISKRKQ